MIYIVGGFCAAIASVAIPLAFIPGMRLARYPDISLACGVIFQTAEACRAGAASAGYVTSGALLLALILAVFMARRWAKPVETRTPAPWAYTAALVAVTTLVGAHVVAQLSGPYYVSRGANITREATFVSLESLAWPVLLQLMNCQRRLRDKFFYLAAVLPIVAVSPYRAIVVEILFFGFALPLWAHWWDRAGGDRFELSRGIRYAGAFAAVVLVVGVLIYSQTRNRLEETGLAPEPGQLRAQTAMRLVQRVTYPLFQAYFAEVVAAHESLPTLADEVLWKIRVGRQPDLDRYLYSLVYGRGTVGGMTSLFYGEAVAYSKSPAMIWIVVAPLLLVTIWLVCRRHGYDIGTLMSIQILRGSLGGLVPLLPALGFQICVVMVLYQGGRGGSANPAT
jgi:hypothetical protein